MKMNKSITLNRLLDLIREDGIIVKIENRIPYKDYGFPNNHAEVLNYINDADGDLWDTMIFGYNKQGLILFFGKKTTSILFFCFVLLA